MSALTSKVFNELFWMDALKAYRTKLFDALLVLMLLASPIAKADRVAYGAVVDLSAETESVRAEHHHDWSARSRSEQWATSSPSTDPFVPGNDYSYLLLRDKSTGVILFRQAAPAFTYIWVSPDSKYVVGISNIKLRNPYQVIVFSKSGTRLLERNLVDASWTGVTQGVTNWIKWYKEPVPQITIVEKDKIATLSVEDAAGAPRQFEFPLYN